MLKTTTFPRLRKKVTANDSRHGQHPAQYPEPPPVTAREADRHDGTINRRAVPELDSGERRSQELSLLTRPPSVAAQSSTRYGRQNR
jgi:hypothetical protein